jgi:adenylate cyclase
MSETKRKLTTILVADAVGFSKMMGVDEAGTLRTLKACRDVIDGAITEHHGRVFGGAGDSVVAEFPSPVEAVLCASEFQKRLGERNAHHGDGERMEFRVGLNLGDVIIDGDNLYGEGVNVAARLESIAEPGGICVSNKIEAEVRRKLDLVFVDGGTRELKNIIDPVGVYHVRRHGDDAGTPGPSSADPGSASDGVRPTVAVLPVKVISGDDEIQSLAEGLREDIAGALAKQTAIAVSGDDGGAADFRLEGSVRVSGRRLRLAFTLVDAAGGSQAWSERYDRELDDLFDLEDEISENVSSAVRLRIKSREFERLRGTDDSELSVPQLLSKAAGYFVRSYGDNDAAAGALTAALERAPENSMAAAMMVYCRWRMHEYSVLDMPAEERDDLADRADRAVSFDPNGFFARLIAALVAQDLRGDFAAALAQAETALELNSGFVQAAAMAGIAKCHMGEVADGLDMLRRAIAAAPEDPHRFRHLRERAVIHVMAGEHDSAIDVMTRLIGQAPDLARNKLVLAAFAGMAGDRDKSKAIANDLLTSAPGLTLRTMRPLHFGDDAMAQRYAEALLEAGLPET